MFTYHVFYVRYSILRDQSSESDKGNYSNQYLLSSIYISLNWQRQIWVWLFKNLHRIDTVLITFPCFPVCVCVCTCVIRWLGHRSRGGFFGLVLQLIYPSTHWIVMFVYNWKKLITFIWMDAGLLWLIRFFNTLSMYKIFIRSRKCPTNKQNKTPTHNLLGGRYNLPYLKICIFKVKYDDISQIYINPTEPSPPPAIASEKTNHCLPCIKLYPVICIYSKNMAFPLTEITGNLV